jgi:hypothetical protein
MFPRITAVLILPLALAVPGHAQLTQDARYGILAGMIAVEGAARIPMPLGKSGVELSEAGLINRDKLQKEIANEGSVITPGKVVTITAIEFHDKSIDFEIDGGGTKKKNILSNIQVGVGGVSSADQQRKPTPDARGSRISLMFAGKVPQSLTSDELKNLLNPVLDFSKQSLLRTGIEALPPEFQEAVKAKEARIGMDSNTVLLALGQPNKRIRNSQSGDNEESEDWLYIGRGRRQMFVTFEKDVVVSIRQYE